VKIALLVSQLRWLESRPLKKIKKNKEKTSVKYIALLASLPSGLNNNLSTLKNNKILIICEYKLLDDDEQILKNTRLMQHCNCANNMFTVADSQPIITLNTYLTVTVTHYTGP